MQVHGGDIYRNQVELDFSANINPLGTPASVIEAAIQGVRNCAIYPDVECGRLKQAIAKTHGVKDAWIFCGNGAAEVIFSLVLAKKPKRALVFVPTFLEYEQALKSISCEITYVPLKKETGFSFTEQCLEQLSTGLDMVFLCNPNNPTGELIAPKLLKQMVETCNKQNTLLVVDECFMNFVNEEDQCSLSSILWENQSIFLLKAFTKMYGMAGLRLGYGLSSDTTLIARMKQVTQPWNVSTPAQYAGVAALKEKEFVIRTRELIARERTFLKTELKKLGLNVYGSRANYIFFEGPNDLYERFLERFVLIRSCKNYRGLNGHYYRIAVKNHEENSTFIQLLKEILAWQK